MMPFSTITSGGCSPKCGGGKQLRRAPAAAGQPRGPQRRPADRHPTHRRLALEQLLPVGRALDQHLLDVQQLGVRPRRRRARRSTRSRTRMPFPRPIAAERMLTFRPRVMRGEPRFDPAANLLVDGGKGRRRPPPPATTVSIMAHLKPNQQQLITRAKMGTGPPWQTGDRGLGVRNWSPHLAVNYNSLATYP